MDNEATRRREPEAYLIGTLRMSRLLGIKPLHDDEVTKFAAKSAPALKMKMLEPDQSLCRVMNAIRQVSKTVLENPSILANLSQSLFY